MVISIDFCGTQRSITRKRQIRMPYATPTRVIDVVSYLKEKFPDLSIEEELVLVTVNAEAASLDQELNAYDKIAFVPHIGGG